MKKSIYILLIVTIVSLATLSSTGLLAFAQVSEAECDSVFFDTFTELMPDEDSISITANKELLYDINLEPLGYMYLFNTDQSGYAIVINSLGYYECTEIYFNAQNPYKDYESIKIYITEFAYCVFEDGNYINVDTDLVIDMDIIELMHEKAYFADSIFTYSEETVTFTSRNDNKYELATRVPQYYSNGTANGCVPVTGGNLILYYTRYLPNLMPGFTPGSYLGTAYLYKVLAPEIDQLVNTLKVDMGTASNNGTTIPQFKTGMSTYCNRKGYNISYNSCMSGSSFNYLTAKQRLASGQPLVVFTDPFAVTTLTVSGSSETLYIMSVNGAHAMSSFGYREITYTFSNNQTRTDTYIQVSVGLDIRSIGYCKLDNKTTFDDAYSINIY